MVLLSPPPLIDSVGLIGCSGARNLGGFWCGMANLYPKRLFTKRFAEAIMERLSGLTIERLEEAEIEFVADDGWKFSVYTDNAYERYEAGEEIEEIAMRFAESLFEMRAAHSPGDDSVYACLRGQDHVDDLRNSGVQAFSEPIADDIALLLCRDLPTSVAMLNVSEVPEEDAPRNDLVAKARANILRFAAPLEYQDHDGFSQYLAGGDIEASLILSEEFVDQIEYRHGRRFVFAVPTRSHLLIGLGDSAFAIAGLDKAAKVLFADDPYRISDQLYLYDNGEISVYE